MRFAGAIAGVGSSSGVRIVVGRWLESPFGSFVDAMVEDGAGHRTLLAPSREVGDFIGQTYVFDEVWVGPVAVTGIEGGWSVSADGHLTVRVAFGARMAVGWLLRAVPEPVATSPTWAATVDPVARAVLRGVRTRGTARDGRREWYGATDLRHVTGIDGSWRGRPLGELRPVDPPCRFGFTSTPRAPSVTSVVTTVSLDARS